MVTLLVLDANVTILAREGEGEEEEKDGGTTVVEDEALLQERNRSDVLFERCQRSSLASGLHLFRLFPQQNLCFSVQFWSLSLSFSLSLSEFFYTPVNIFVNLLKGVVGVEYVCKFCYFVC